MTLLLEMFTYPFIVRAFAAGVLLSLCAALLGVPLVLKRYSMIGDGLSHVSFGALSVALACGWAPLPVSIPVVIVAALGLVGTLVGSYLANRKSTALIAYRLEQLEQKVSKHNNLVERTYALEESVALMDERVRVANHRIADLEGHA